ncbi:MAG: superinfection immunity protein [Clostridiales bacterium]|jgi:hypothetical protein|nr:superinfection immunity protein [Clostridiales bacterium]
MGEFFGTVWGVITIIASTIIYFIPTIIALKRDHRNKVGIILLNIFLGWTFVGWIGSLIWALSKK